MEVEITAEMLEPLVDGINSNMTVIVPVGLTIMAAFIGIKMIPRVVGWFIK